MYIPCACRTACLSPTFPAELLTFLFWRQSELEFIRIFSQSPSTAEFLSTTKLLPTSSVSTLGNACVLFSTGMLRVRTFSSCSVSLDVSLAAVKPFSAIPGPKPLPLVGNMVIMGAHVNRFTAFQEQCFKKYGEIFKLKLLGKYLLRSACYTS